MKIFLNYFYKQAGGPSWPQGGRGTALPLPSKI